MTNYNYTVADVFTDTPMQGNPVAVFPRAAGLSTGRMQQIAEEMRLSETVFVFPPQNGADAYVRIFTPVNELPFAGHPTLGTAIVLGESHDANVLKMETAMGTIPFELDRSPKGQTRAAKMVQPIPEWEEYDRSDDLLKGLDLVGSTLPIEVYRNGPRHVYVGLPSIDALSQLTPDHRILSRLPDVAVNCFAGEGCNWRMRMFSPAYGVVEDAATGSAAGPLAVHLLRHSLIPNDQEITINQGVEMGRHSVMRAQVHGSADNITKVEVSGAAVIVARGTLFV